MQAYKPRTSVLSVHLNTPQSQLIEACLAPISRQSLANIEQLGLY